MPSLQDVNPGFYEATVDRVDFEKSPRKGTPGLKVSFTFDVAEADAFGQVHATTTVWLSEAAIRMARQQLRVLGYDPDRGSLGELAKNPTLLAGNTFEVEVTPEEYQGSIRNVARIPVGGKPVPVGEIDALDKALKAAASSGEEPVRQPQSSARPKVDPGPGYDDIPF